MQIKLTHLDIWLPFQYQKNTFSHPFNTKNYQIKNTYTLKIPKNTKNLKTTPYKYQITKKTLLEIPQKY